MTTSLRVASTLCWVWGVLLLLSSLALGIPMLAAGAVPIAAVLLLGTAVLFGVAGWGLRNERRPAGVLALGLSAVWILVCGFLAVITLASGAAVPGAIFPGIVANAAILVLVVRSWSNLQ